MAPRTQPEDDDWRHVEDAKKRKKIQDRLAQRARRQRLREAKTNAKQQKQQGETSGRDETQDEQRHMSQQPPLPAVSCDLSSTPLDLSSLVGLDLDMIPSNINITECNSPFIVNRRVSSESSIRPNNLEESEQVSSQNSTNEIAGSHSFSHILDTTTASGLSSLRGQPAFPLSVFGALYINGSILGLTCGTVVPSRSTPCRPDVPLLLQPTYTQLTVLHSRWIDRFPFPKMRDNIINLGSVVDDEELLKDLILMPSFDITPGKLPWDPEAWIIQKPFAEKWGYLFFKGAENI